MTVFFFFVVLAAPGLDRPALFTQYAAARATCGNAPESIWHGFATLQEVSLYLRGAGVPEDLLMPGH